MRAAIIILWLLSLVDLSASETGWIRSTNTAANWTRTSYYITEPGSFLSDPTNLAFLSEQSLHQKRQTSPQRHVALPILLTLVLWYVALKRRGLIVMGMLLLATNQASAAQTLLKRSMFVPPSMTNVAPITATNLCGFDNMASLSTLWPVIATGATTNGQGGLGWSGWVQKGFTNACVFTNLTANTYYQFSCWFRLHQYSTSTASDNPNSDASTSASRMFQLGRAGDLGQALFGIAGGGSFWLQNINGATTNIALLELNKWYYFACAWRSTNSAGTFKKDGRIYLGTLGSTATNIYSFDDVNCTAAITFFSVGLYSVGGSFHSALYTGASIHTLADFTDAGIPIDINPPVESRTSWYVNPGTGSDLNSGLYPTNAWATAYRVVQLLKFGGAKGGYGGPWRYTADETLATPGSNPWAFNRGIMDGSIHATGDRILIDTSSAVLYTTNTFETLTNNIGVELGSATAAPAKIRPWSVITGTWTQYDAVNFPNIWQIANYNGQSNTVVFENQKWMNNPTNLSGLVNLTTNLNSTPGSFWSDTTNLYVHPFGSTNPNSDGKLYERTEYLYNYAPTIVLTKYSVIELLDNGTLLNNLQVWGAPYRDQYNGNWFDNYVIYLANNGPSVIGNCDFRYGGKHVYGGVGGSTTLYRFNYNSTYEQGPPWDDVLGTGAGSEVEFASSGVGTRRVYFWNCNVDISSAIGSTDGVQGVDAFFSHVSGSAFIAYQDMHYFNCRGSFNCAYEMVSNGGLIISNSVTPFNAPLTISVGSTNNMQALVVRSRINGPVVGSGVTVKDSIIYRADNLGQENTLSGPYTFIGVTFDCRDSTNTSAYSMLKTASTGIPVPVTISNSLVLLPNTAANITLLRYKTNDTLTLNNNVYLLNAQGNCNYFQNGGTPVSWANWQANGYDTTSNTNNPAIGPGYRPYAKTPTWNVATDRGASIDFTGKLFQSRRTAGAYEYDPPWMMLP